MNSTQGKPLTSEVKRVIVSIKLYFDSIKISPKESSTKRVADAVGIGETTVKRIMANYNKDPQLLDNCIKMRGRPPHLVGETNQELVRDYIRTANKNGEYITLKNIKEYLKNNTIDEGFHIATLARTLNRWGYEFGKGTRSQHLKEKDYVIVARQRYLRAMRANRDKYGIVVRNEIYLDESYVNKNHSNDYIWYSGEDGPWVQKPTGQGERLIIMNAISNNGWVQGAKLVFKSTRKTGDYHGQMNWDIFKKWFVEMLLPNIPKNSIIIMDNASYHNKLSDISPPTFLSSKSKIIKWFDDNAIAYTKDLLKPELVEILNKESLQPIFKIDEIAEKYGHKILRTPPYHPELQPIEICWGVVKNHVARNCDFSMKNLTEQLDAGFKKVTKNTCMKIIKKIRKVENKFWKDDKKIDLSK
ncbi:MAG: transposase [Bacteroidales bacterium]|nr:transposase [Bacteroidales bacterium]